MTQIQQHSFNFGRDYEILSHSFDFDKIVAFVSGKDDLGGAMNFYKLKPLFDKYGYHEVLEKIKQEANKNLEVVDENLESVNGEQKPEVTESPASMFWESKEQYKGANENE